MNRLKKKCVIAIAGTHLLLLTILIVGPAFFNQQPKADNTQVLEMIPSAPIDAMFNSGVKNATPPPSAPQPVVQPQPQPVQPQQIAPPPKSVEPTPSPSILDRVKNIFESKPVKSTPPKPETQPHKIEPNLKPVVRTGQQNVANPRDARVISTAIQNLKHNLKSGTEINLSGSSSVAYANYASVVRSVYDAAWTLPNTIAKDENITVSVTIASDGTVISSRIVTSSGDAPADASVQRTLDRVSFVEAFPEGSTDKERTYTIIFNPQVKNSE